MEEQEEAASEQRRCQCARERRVGLGVGVNVATQSHRKRRSHRATHRALRCAASRSVGSVSDPPLTQHRESDGAPLRRMSEFAAFTTNDDDDDAGRRDVTATTTTTTTTAAFDVCASFVIHVAAVKCVYATAQRYVTDVWFTKASRERASERAIRNLS